MKTKALDRDVELDLIRKAKAGDQEAIASLIKQFENHLWTLVRSCRLPPNYSQEDCYQEAVLSFITGLSLYDESRGNRLITFIQRYILHRLWRSCKDYVTIAVPRHYKTLKERDCVLAAEIGTRPIQSLNRNISKGGLGTRELIDTLLDPYTTETQPEDILDYKEQMKSLRRVLRKLNRVHLKILIQRARGKTLEQVAQLYNVTKERIRQKQVRATQCAQALARGENPYEFSRIPKVSQPNGVSSGQGSGESEERPKKANATSTRGNG